MNAKNHLIFSFSFVLLFIKILNNFFNINIDLWHTISSSFISCLLPDLDHPKSLIGLKLKYINFLWFFFGHRKFTHSLFGFIIFLFLLLKLNLIYFNFNLDIIIGMLLGYFSHILADMLTINGINFLWPIKLKFRIPIIYFFLKKYEYYFCLIMLFFSLFIDKIFILKKIFIKIFFICLYYINLIILKY